MQHHSHSHINIEKTNELVIDVAVLNQDYSQLVVRTQTEHIIDLDPMIIPESLFREIFYPHGENFGIVNESCISPTISPYISFSSQLRTVNGQPFVLLDEITNNIETDLNVSRDYFTANSLVSLNKELLAIKTLGPIGKAMCIILFASFSETGKSSLAKSLKRIILANSPPNTDW